MGLKNGNVLQSKFGTISQTDTTATQLFTLPSQAMPVGLRVYGVNSTATTSATITLTAFTLDNTTGTTLGTLNAKTSAAGGVAATLSSSLAYTRSSQPLIIKGVFAQVGAGTTGGPWSVAVDFV